MPSMPVVTLIFAALLIAVGVGGYAAGESGSPTALIPAVAGAVLGLCGLLALREPIRQHAMHAAAAIGLLGALAAGGRLVGQFARGAGPTGLVLFSQAAMAILCAAFVAACVKSFVDARRSRERGAVERA